MTAPGTRIETYIGSQIAPLLSALADLRTEVFREWPYLYDGDAAYERDYLKVYSRNARAMLAIAFDGDKVIGASTCLPMIDAAPNIRVPLEALGLGPGRFFYFGESVLLRAYRGQGLGVKFFAAREAHAIADGVCDHAIFYAVRRAHDHPSRPPHAQPLDSFWHHRGYRPFPGLSCQMQWKEVGMAAETTHTLDAWAKKLKNAQELGSAEE
jgi:GNAT superfamily N-acetyltransferase